MIRYLCLMGLACATAFLAVLGLNYGIDPYDLSIAPGRTAAPVRPETGTHTRVHRAYALRNLQPAVLALGASRTEVAVRMDHPGWMREGIRYNAALTAGGIREIQAYLRLASASGKLRQVLIGLEFYSFNGYLPNRPDFDPRLLAPPGTVPLLDLDTDKARYYASLDALWSSLRTVAGRNGVPHFLLDGRVNPADLESSYQGHAGQRQAFLQADREMLLLYYRPPPRHLYNYSNGTDPSTLQTFREILALARAKGVDLRLYISPSHARGLSGLRLLGLWETYLQWERDLVATLQDEARASGAAAYPLWDFSGFNAVTTEAIAADDPAGPRSRWYWESSHYRAELGDYLLDRIFGTTAPSRPPIPGLGEALEPASLEAHLRRLDSDEQAWRQGHDKDMAELRALQAGGNP